MDSLLDELDKKDSLLSDKVIETSLINIIKKTSNCDDNFNAQSIANWRTENEDAYRSLKVLNKTRYSD